MGCDIDTILFVAERNAMNKIGLDGRGMSGINPSNLGITSLGIQGSTIQSPSILPVRTTAQVQAALKGSLEAMLTIARTGGIDLKTVSGLPSGSPPASAAAPKIIIVKDPTGASICATEMFAEEIPIGSVTFPTALKFYIDTTEELSKAAPGRLWGTRVPPSVQFRDRLVEVILQKIDPLTDRITAATPSTNAAKQPDEERIKTRYIEFLKIFKEDMTTLRTMYKESDVKVLADYLNEKFQRSLRKALEVDELRHAMMHGKSALVSAAAGATAARNVAVSQAAELQARIQQLERDLVDADPAEHARLQAEIDRLTRLSATSLSQLSQARTALATTESARASLELEKKGKQAEAEYSAIVSRGETLGDILSSYPAIGVDATQKGVIKRRINDEFNEKYNISAVANTSEYYSQQNRRLIAYNSLKTKIEAIHNGTDRVRSNAFDGELAELGRITDNAIAKRKVANIFASIMAQRGGSRRATRHRSRRNRAKTQRR